ncbi:GNAT family N-acetyltransferase [Streptantibioticus silvisoli]|uniref:GNAT family N-acetyltransferase n=1 Tax=Streptantibioticus silvisoli TaxID=2705255 RepID=A0ABT6W2W9_9ACTN|nr:GNAT family N-acetyltransferase [Streptantibioticus silvisoli]MDI5965085.1 GNAT family N-acetyltransferase [Streptantibioticus silvisoli]
MVEISADGLLLRPWREEDAPRLLRGFTDPEFRRWSTPRVTVADERDAVDVIRGRALGWRRGDTASFAVTEDGVVVGSVALNLIDWFEHSARVSYWTLPEARGRGIAIRALERAGSWALGELRLHRLELRHAVGHQASCAVAQACGYALEGTLRGAMIDPAGGFRALHVHGRVADRDEARAGDADESPSVAVRSDDGLG